MSQWSKDSEGRRPLRLLLRLFKALLVRLYSGSFLALFWLYSGSILALFWLCSGAITVPAAALRAAPPASSSKAL